MVAGMQAAEPFAAKAASPSLLSAYPTETPQKHQYTIVAVAGTASAFWKKRGLCCFFDPTIALAGISLPSWITVTNFLEKVLQYFGR
jgi:hypothetical protein